MTTARRSLILIEAFVFSAYVGWFIWRLQTSIRPSWLVFPVWMLASFLIHRDTPKTLGWHQALFSSLSAMHSRAVRRGSCSGRRASAYAPSPNSKSFFWLHGVLPAPAGGPEFLSDKPALWSNRQHSKRFAALRDNFCGPSLAESRAGSAHLRRRSRHGLAFCARAQHHSARHLARHSGNSSLVGVSGRVASCHARGPRVLPLSPTMMGG